MMNHSSKTASPKDLKHLVEGAVQAGRQRFPHWFDNAWMHRRVLIQTGGAGLILMVGLLGWTLSSFQLKQLVLSTKDLDQKQALFTKVRNLEQANAQKLEQWNLTEEALREKFALPAEPLSQTLERFAKKYQVKDFQVQLTEEKVADSNLTQIRLRLTGTSPNERQMSQYLASFQQQLPGILTLDGLEIQPVPPELLQNTATQRKRKPLTFVLQATLTLPRGAKAWEVKDEVG